MGQDNQEWSWVGEDGTEHAGDESELSFALSSEELPVHTLVCKKGWGEWLPAMQVAELQWALPAGRADNPRKPAMGRKPKPPVELYPSLKKRARDIARGIIDPAAESSLSLPSITRPPAARSRAELDRVHQAFSASDQDEPTLQIDADALDYAFEQLQEGRAVTEESQAAAESPVARPSRQDSTRERPAPPPSSGKKAPARPATASKPKLSLSARKARKQAPHKTPSPPPPAPVRHASPLPGAPLTGAPAIPSDPPTVVGPRPQAPGLSSAPPTVVGPGAKVPAPAGFRPNAMAPTPVPSGVLDSRPSLGSSPGLSPPPLAEPLPQPKKPLWPWVALLLAGAIGLAFFLLGRSKDEQPAPTPVATTTEPAKTPEPPKPVCEVSTTPVAVAGWAHIAVRPILGRAPGEDRVAVGYAQTSKLAVGLVLDIKTLNAEKPYSNYQNSPLLSVTPVTHAMGSQLEFLESRAASTLQSAVYVPAKEPFIIGQNKYGVAVRRESEGDDVLWKPQWATINVPSTARIDADTHLVVVRAGGERGAILMAKVSETGHAKGELQELAPGTTKLGFPTVTTGRGRVVVAFDGTDRSAPDEKHIYLASWTKTELSGKAKSVLDFDEPVTAVGAVALPQGAHLIQYTLGELTEQRVLAQVVSKDNKPLGKPVLVSPHDKDAYNGELIQLGDHVLVSYMVRSGANHEFWATTLKCTVE